VGRWQAVTAPRTSWATRSTSLMYRFQNKMPN